MTRHPALLFALAGALACSPVISRPTLAQSPAGTATRAGAESSTKTKLTPAEAARAKALSEKEKEAKAQKQWLKVVVTSSRTEIARGAEWGVTADLTNTSTTAITVDPNDLQLIVQPETGDHSFCEIGPHHVVTLQPQSHTAVVFHPCSPWPRTLWDRVLKHARNQLDYLSFVPGSYTFTIEGEAHLPDSKLYQPFADSIPVKLSLGQLTMCCWAGMGSVIAFFVTLSRKTTRSDDNPADTTLTAQASSSALAIVSFAGKLLSSFLLGASLSVVTNRLADTSFPLKVSVNDVWGAISVGFVFYFIGNKIIDKLVSNLTEPSPKTGSASTRPLRNHLPVPGSQTA